MKVEIDMSKTYLEVMQESEEKFHKLAENSFAGMFLYNEYFIYVNDAFARMTGYSVEELLKMHPWDLVDVSNKEKFKELVLRRLKGEMFCSVYNEAVVIKKNKKALHLKISVETTHYRGAYAGIGIAVDISDIIEKDSIIKVLTQALQQSDDIVFITDISGEIIYVNDALLNLYGYSTHEVLGKTPRIFASHKHTKDFYKNLWDTILSGKNYHETIINKKKDGSLIFVDTKITPVRDETGISIAHFAVTARDITKRIEIEEKLRKQAMLDSLTELPNRYQLEIYFNDFISRAKRYGHPFSVLMIDIDHFKYINDQHGHLVGDKILKSLSMLLLKNIRENDKIARWGGEEFIILLDGVQEHQAMYIAEKLNLLVSQTKLEGLYCITVSIGVTQYREGDTKESCIQRADKALYAAKDLGRDRVVFN